MLSDAITTAVAYARDNEVFVICADLMESAQSISHLLSAIRLARARHHRVAFVCPTPAFRRPTRESLEIRDVTAEGLLLVAEQMRSREFADRLQHELRQAGATVTFSGEQNAIRMIIAEMELARSGRASSGSGSAR